MSEPPRPEAGATEGRRLVILVACGFRFLEPDYRDIRQKKKLLSRSSEVSSTAPCVASNSSALRHL
jgi:hypothetical protein